MNVPRIKVHFSAVVPGAICVTITVSNSVTVFDLTDMGSCRNKLLLLDVYGYFHSKYR